MTNEELVASLKDSGVITSAAVEGALRAIDRARFVPEELKSSAYLDTALPIAEGQTISQPTVVALCLEWLQVRPGDRVLDVGSGSGWTTALLAHLTGPTGSVIGTERISALVAFGSANLSTYAFAHAHIEQAGDELGKRDAAPFDRILVSAAAEDIPNTLVEQLKYGGRMVIPIREAICVISHTDGQISTEYHHGFTFVPLIT